MKQIEHDEIKLRIGDMLSTWDNEEREKKRYVSNY